MKRWNESLFRSAVAVVLALALSGAMASTAAAYFHAIPAGDWQGTITDDQLATTGSVATGARIDLTITINGTWVATRHSTGGKTEQWWGSVGLAGKTMLLDGRTEDGRRVKLHLKAGGGGLTGTTVITGQGRDVTGSIQVRKFG